MISLEEEGKKVEKIPVFPTRNLLQKEKKKGKQLRMPFSKLYGPLQNLKVIACAVVVAAAAAVVMAKRLL